jgi:hypothetical protein
MTFVRQFSTRNRDFNRMILGLMAVVVSSIRRGVLISGGYKTWF